jgi:hypothetical protein
MQQLVVGASAACGWLQANKPEVRRVLIRCIDRICVNAETVEVQISKSSLRRMLIHRLDIDSDKPANSNKTERSDDRLVLSIAARFKLCCGEVRLVVAPRQDGEPPSYQTSSLLKAVARGHEWYQQLIQGTVSGPRALAKQTGLDERYTYRILRCAFLAPDIVEGILAGAQPADLHIESLLDGVSQRWADQRKQFGFPASR